MYKYNYLVNEKLYITTKIKICIIWFFNIIQKILYIFFFLFFNIYNSKNNTNYII